MFEIREHKLLFNLVRDFCCKGVELTSEVALSQPLVEEFLYFGVIVTQKRSSII